MIGRFHAEKDRRGLLDYDDLIDKTRDLLTAASAAWVHYKLDLGIDHVLIDEAQDTSPRQWGIVRALVAEFSSGEGAHAGGRTIFAVGDDKQSIFSFQGAVPGEFDAEAPWPFQRDPTRSGRAAVLAGSSFFASFRSVESVWLDAVDLAVEAA